MHQFGNRLTLEERDGSTTRPATLLLAIGVLLLCASPASGQLVILDSRGSYDAYHYVATGAGLSDFRSELSVSGRQVGPHGNELFFIRARVWSISTP